MKCVYVYSIYSQYMYAACTYIYFGVGHSRVLLEYCTAVQLSVLIFILALVTTLMSERTVLVTFVDSDVLAAKVRLLLPRENCTVRRF
jgi:hypothetical protein